MNLYGFEEGKSEKSGTVMQAPIGEKQVLTELTADFSLPDYQPEIKRLLRVSAVPMPADRYIGAGNAELAGNIDYTVLYAGEDGEIYCTVQSGEYQQNFPVELPADFDAGEGILCDAETWTESVTGRVAGPRKLTLRCRLRTRARLYGSRILEEHIGGAAEESLQKLYGECPAAHLFTGSADLPELADEILPEAGAGEVRVISAAGEVAVSEAAAGSGCVNCRGDIYLKLLCAKENGEVFSVTRKIPFSQSVGTEGAEINCEACAAGTCTGIKVTVEEGKILCEVSVRLRTRAQRNETVRYTRDVFSTESPCETSYRTVGFPQSAGVINGNVTVDQTFPLTEIGIRQGMRVVDVSGNVSGCTAEAEKGKYVITGKCRFHLILAGDGDYAVQEVEAPFRYETDGAKAVPTEADITSAVLSCRGKIEGEKLMLDAEIGLGAALRGEVPVILLSDANAEGKWDAKESACRICYPGKEDTLWSVAKRYHCPVEKLVKENRLENSASADRKESLEGVRWLFV